MRISKENPQPVYEYHLVLTEDEFHVISSAVALADYTQMKDRLKRICPSPIDNPHQLIFEMHSDLENFRGCKNL